MNRQSLTLVVWRNPGTLDCIKLFIKKKVIYQTCICLAVGFKCSTIFH